jgi:hypothetical protein
MRTAHANLIRPQLGKGKNVGKMEKPFPRKGKETEHLGQRNRRFSGTLRALLLVLFLG